MIYRNGATMKVIASFSGGKYSVLSIDRAMREHEVVGLLTTFRDESSWFHELSRAKLQQIADAMRCQFFPITVSGGEEYTSDFVAALIQIKEEIGIEGIVFGDIDLESHRAWCENLAEQAGLAAIFPLWGENREALVAEFLGKGYKTLIKKVDKNKLGANFLGKTLTSDITQEIKSMGYDPCGENGEYHTMVYDGPTFAQAVEYSLGEIYEDDWSWMIRVE